jgi:hypothetical protein
MQNKITGYIREKSLSIQQDGINYSDPGSIGLVRKQIVPLPIRGNTKCDNLEEANAPLNPRGQNVATTLKSKIASTYNSDRRTGLFGYTITVITTLCLNELAFVR